eukprot:9216451-Alexandrium_andersonii.AAC.1
MRLPSISPAVPPILGGSGAMTALMLLPSEAGWLPVMVPNSSPMLALSRTGLLPSSPGPKA